MRERSSNSISETTSAADILKGVCMYSHSLEAHCYHCHEHLRLLATSSETNQQTIHVYRLSCYAKTSIRAVQETKIAPLRVQTAGCFARTSGAQLTLRSVAGVRLDITLPLFPLLLLPSLPPRPPCPPCLPCPRSFTDDPCPISPSGLLHTFSLCLSVHLSLHR